MLSSSIDNSLNTENPCDCIISDLRLLIRFGQIFGCFPFRIQKQSSHASIISTVLLIYSFALYAIGSYSTFLIVQEFSIVYNDDNIQSKVSLILFITFWIYTLLVGPVCWCNGHSFIIFLRQFCRFQCGFKRCTGKLLTLSVRSLSFKTLSFFGVWTIISFTVFFFINEQRDMLSYALSMLSSTPFIFSLITFVVLCESCKLSFRNLNEDIVFTLKRSSKTSCKLLKDYRELYSSMFHITSRMGNCFSGPWTVMLLFFLAAYIMSCFACAVGLLDNFDRNYLSFIPVFMFSLFGILVFCCWADSVSSEVRNYMSCECNEYKTLASLCPPATIICK